MVWLPVGLESQHLLFKGARSLCANLSSKVGARLQEKAGGSVKTSHKSGITINNAPVLFNDILHMSCF